MIDGARTSIVRTTKRFRLVTSCCGVSGAVRLRFTVGISSAPKSIGVAKIRAIKKKRFTKTSYCCAAAALSSTLCCALSFVESSRE